MCRERFRENLHGEVTNLDENRTTVSENVVTTPGRGEGGAGWLRSFWGRHYREILIFTFFFWLSMVLTWPLITKLNSSIYGYPADNMGYLWFMWWTRNYHALGGTAGFSRFIGYPFGSQFSPVGMEYISVFTDRFLLVFFNEVIVYNIRIFLSFFLSGVTMYFLARHLIKDRRAAFIGGTAYLVVTFHSYHALSIPSLALIEWMPLFILAMLVFVEKRTWNWAVLAALSWVLVAATSIHYGFFMAVFAPSFLIGRYIYLKYRQSRDAKAGGASFRLRPGWDRRFLVKVVVVMLLAILLTAPTTLFGLSQVAKPGKWPTSTTPGMTRSDYNVDWGAVYVSDYLLPCSMNPVFGKIANALVPKRQAYLESVYLGWSLIILALVGLFLLFMPWFRIKPRAPDDLDPPDPDRVAKAEELKPWKPNMVGFLTAGVIAFVLTMPTHLNIGPVRIPLPSVLFFRYIRWFRWYMRFAIVVIICVTILACYGLVALFKMLEGKDRRILVAIAVMGTVAGLEYAVAVGVRGSMRWVLAAVVLVGAGVLVFVLYRVGDLFRENGMSFWPYVLTGVVTLLVILEMIIIPPVRSFDFSHVPDLYGFMKKQPGSTYVIYPAYEPGYFNNSQYMFYQRYHRRPMLNGGSENTDGEALRRTVYNPYDPGVFSILAHFGINHVVFLDGMFSAYEGHDTSDNLVKKLPGGLKKVARFKDMDELFGNAYVYEVTAKPAEVVPIYQGDISVPHIDVGLLTARLLGARGGIRLLNYSGHDMNVTMDVPLTNLGTKHHFVAKAGTKELASLDLFGSDSAVMRLENLKVPKGGLVVDIQSSGKAVNVVQDEQFLFGVGTAYASMGALTLVPLGQ